LRADLPGQSNQSEILNDDCIHLGFPDPAKQSFGFDEFRGEDQYIEREVSATSTGMKVIHDKGKIGFGEIFSSEAGIEGWKAEIDGIGPCGNGSFEAIPVSRWGEEFRFKWRGHP
jgi:hypothetical protein